MALESLRMHSRYHHPSPYKDLSCRRPYFAVCFFCFVFFFFIETGLLLIKVLIAGGPFYCLLVGLVWIGYDFLRQQFSV